MKEKLKKIFKVIGKILKVIGKILYYLFGVLLAGWVIFSYWFYIKDFDIEIKVLYIAIPIMLLLLLGRINWGLYGLKINLKLEIGKEKIKLLDHQIKNIKDMRFVYNSLRGIVEVEGVIIGVSPTSPEYIVDVDYGVGRIYCKPEDTKEARTSPTLKPNTKVLVELDKKHTYGTILKVIKEES